MRTPSRMRVASRVGVIRLAVGVVACLALAVIALRLRAEAHHSRGALDALRTAHLGLVSAAAGMEALSYVAIAFALVVLVPGLRATAGTQIALAAFGAGGLLPGAPLGGGALTVRELTRRGLPLRRASLVAASLLVGIPAASMALLAGPTLCLSAAWAPLPSGWRVLVSVLGAVALVLGGAILASIFAPARVIDPVTRRLPPWLAGPATRRRRGSLLGLGVAYWLGDVASLWLVARSLGIALPLATLPMAYVTGAVVIAIPVLPGGLGGVEAAVPLVLATGSVRFADAVLAVFAWRALSFWLPAAIGLVCLASLRRGVNPSLLATGSHRPHPSAADERAASR